MQEGTSAAQHSLGPGRAALLPLLLLQPWAAPAGNGTQCFGSITALTAPASSSHSPHYPHEAHPAWLVLFWTCPSIPRAPPLGCASTSLPCVQMNPLSHKVPTALILEVMSSPTPAASPTLIFDNPRPGAPQTSSLKTRSSQPDPSICCCI